MDRRTFIRGAGVGLGMASVGRAARADVFQTLLSKAGVSSRNARTPIKHLVVVMQENRSVDHFQGWYGAENPNFNGIQNAAFPDLRQGPDGPLVATQNWGRAGKNNFHGRGWEDPSHGWSGGRHERAGGAMNGWLDPRTGNDEFCLSYYDAVDLPVWAQLTRNWRSYDAWHCSLLAATLPNRYYMHSGQSGGLKSNDTPPELASEHNEWIGGWDWPTIWTLLDRAGVTSAYYYSNLPVIGLWGPRHISSFHHVSEYFAAAEAGQLPQVSFIDPYFTLPDDIGNDDHPHADVRLGQAFLSDVVEAFTSSRNYRNGAMVITYDEWGGFWDHAAPPRIDDDRATPSDPGGDDDFGQIGVRIPSTIVSPWTRGGGVDHTVYDHASVVRFIQDNWHLPNLTKRTASTNSIEHAFGGFADKNNHVAFRPYDPPLSAVQNSLSHGVEHQLENPTSLEVFGSDVLQGVINGVLGQVPGVPEPEPLSTGGSDMAVARDMGWFDKFGIRTDYKFEDGFLRSRPELLAETRGIASARR